MVKIYSVTLALGVVGLLVVIFGGAFADNRGRPDRDPNRRMGPAGRVTLGALLGFGMAGLSAEFSNFDLSWQMALLVAVAGAATGALWVRHASRPGSGSDAGPV